MSKKTILITGATRGIGWAIAQAAAQENYHVILNGRDPEQLALRVETLKNNYPDSKIDALLFDVTDRVAIAQAALSVGKIDVLINNAGIALDSWWIKMSPEVWDEVIATNLTGVFNVTHFLTENIKDGGQIVMMSSRSALFGNMGQANYAASKAALIALSKTLAQELKRRDIRVNCLAPEAMTEMTVPAIEKVKKRYDGKLPEEWQIGSSQQVADFVVHHLFHTDQTGQVYAVNGDEIGYWEEPLFHNLPRDAYHRFS